LASGFSLLLAGAGEEREDEEPILKKVEKIKSTLKYESH